MNQYYFDNASTTKTDREIAEIVTEVLTQAYGNPSSLHRLGLQANQYIQKADTQIKKALGIKEGKLYFTSGGTEANNTAIFGAVKALHRRGNEVVTTALEHSSVADSCKELATMGYTVHVTPPRGDGVVYAEDIIGRCTKDTILVSALYINNETGSILDVAALVKGVRKVSPKAYIHIDGVQAVGKHPINLSGLDVDLFTFSGHKIYAPKGIGCLYVKKGVRILPLLHGGSQQEGIRPGTENVAYIAALGQAVENAVKAIPAQLEQVRGLNLALRKGVSPLPYIMIHSPEEGSPYILNLSVLGLRSETLLHALEAEGLYLSSGSACAKGATSHVLLAMGLSTNEVDSAIRISFGKHCTLEGVEALVGGIISAKERLVGRK